jgi:hypothetical protein
LTEPRSGAPTLTAGQGGKEQTVNEAVSRLAALSIGSAVSQVSTPPLSPADGAVYLVGLGATGLWAGQENKIAHWRTASAWTFISPPVGSVIRLVTNNGGTLYWDGTDWSPPGGTPPSASAILATNYTMALAPERLPLIVDRPPMLLSWDVTNKRFDITTSGHAIVSYRFEFSGTSSGSSGTAQIHLGESGTISYYLGEIEVLAAATKRIISGSVQIPVQAGDNLYFEAGAFSGISALTLIGGGNSWSQIVLLKS